MMYWMVPNANSVSDTAGNMTRNSLRSDLNTYFNETGQYSAQLKAARRGHTSDERRFVRHEERDEARHFLRLPVPTDKTCELLKAHHEHETADTLASEIALALSVGATDEAPGTASRLVAGSPASTRPA